MIRPLFLLLVLLCGAALSARDANPERAAFKARVRALHQAAFEGSKSASSELKSLQASRQGEKTDYISIPALEAKAAKTPRGPTLLEIGHAYNFGYGGHEPDLKLAAHWYARAARAGSTTAAYNLGIAYFHGNKGLPKDWTIAHGLFLSAHLRSGGHKNALHSLASMAKQEGRYKEAFELYSELGPMDANAYCEAGLLVESGKSPAAATAEAEALALYELAAKAGNPRGRTEAARLLLQAKDPRLRNPSLALRRLADTLEKGGFGTRVKNTLDALLLQADDSADSAQTLVPSESLRELEALADADPTLAPDWHRLSQALARRWPQLQTAPRQPPSLAPQSQP